MGFLVLLLLVIVGVATSTSTSDVPKMTDTVNEREQQVVVNKVEPQYVPEIVADTQAPAEVEDNPWYIPAPVYSDGTGFVEPMKPSIKQSRYGLNATDDSVAVQAGKLPPIEEDTSMQVQPQQAEPPAVATRMTCVDVAKYASTIQQLKLMGVTLKDIDAFSNKPSVATFPVKLMQSDVYKHDFKTPIEASMLYFDICERRGYDAMLALLKR